MFEILRNLLRPTRKRSIFRAEQAATSGVPRVFAGMIVCLVIAGLLSSSRLVDMADRKAFGPSRDRWLAAAERVDDVAHAIGFDRPSAGVDELLDRSDEPTEVVRGELASATTTTPPSTTAPAPTTPSTAVPDQAASTSTTTRPTTTSAPTTTTTTTPPILGDVSVEDPLRIWIGGDSLGEYVGSQLLYQVADPELSSVELDFEISTGLARPDYFDWPARLTDVMQRDDRPQVVVFMVGGNDDQDMQVDGERVIVGTEAWSAAYRRRVATMMDTAAYPGVQMLWVNLPPMRDDRRQSIAVDINAALTAEADLRAWVDVIDVVDLFTGPGGGYEQFLDAPDGETTRKARADDGIHITRAASEWVADIAWDHVLERWRFEDIASN